MIKLQPAGLAIKICMAYIKDLINLHSLPQINELMNQYVIEDKPFSIVS